MDKLPIVNTSVSLEIPEDLPEVYANIVQVITTQWDFTLIFGSTRVATDDDHTIRPLARADIIVRMSPQHAKAFASKLQGLLQNYEATTGPISLPPESDPEEIMDLTGQAGVPS